MAVASPIELCGGCHTDALAAWQAGDHGKADQSCTDCHTVHTHG